MAKDKNTADQIRDYATTEDTNYLSQVSDKVSHGNAEGIIKPIATRARVFAKENKIRTKTKVPQAGEDNHLGILGSAGVWAGVTGNSFMPGFAPGQGQLLMTHDNTNKVGGSRSEQIGADEVVAIGGNATEQVGVAKVIDVGTTLLIKAGTSITLQCGASTIHMNQAGFITISGTVIAVGGAVSCAMVAPLTQITGAVMLSEVGGVIDVRGGVTTIHGHVEATVSGADVGVLAKKITTIKGGEKVNINC